MKKFRIYVTLPVYFYDEVEAENAEDALDKFDFSNNEQTADYRLRYASHIETHVLDEEGEVIDVQEFDD